MQTHSTQQSPNAANVLTRHVNVPALTAAFPLECRAKRRSTAARVVLVKS
jgi:hypothetical protein